jgi:hypothetical protein
MIEEVILFRFMLTRYGLTPLWNTPFISFDDSTYKLLLRPDLKSAAFCFSLCGPSTVIYILLFEFIAFIWLYHRQDQISVTKILQKDISSDLILRLVRWLPLNYVRF